MWIYLMTTLILFANSGGNKCPLPSQPLYSHVTVSADSSKSETTAIYTCDEGYTLLGSAKRNCLSNGLWNGEEPSCVVNIAQGKPTNQSSTVRGGDAFRANHEALQNGTEYCSETKVQNSPWWQLDLLSPYEVKVVQITSRKCCAQYQLFDMEIRVGNSTTIQRNKLCTWHHETLRNGMTKEFNCAYPIIGRYVYIQLVDVYGALSLCNVKVFTTQELAVSRCGQDKQYNKFKVFNNTCYEFVTHLGDSFQAARNYCNEYDGDILHSIGNRTHTFISSELESRRSGLRTLFFWLGARLDERQKLPSWYWINRQKVTSFVWADDQPNNYNNKQNCIALDGNNRWLWNDINCELNDLSWICQYNASNCGSPDRKENSTFSPNLDRFPIGQVIKYFCTTGSRLIGNETRTCRENGFWETSVPICEYIDCGRLPELPNGQVIYEDGRTSLDAKAYYTCHVNFTLSSQDVLVCKENGKWKGRIPICSLTTCRQPDVPRYAQITKVDTTVYSTVKYNCFPGYRLIGQNERTCGQDGKWTGRPPTCKYVRCGRIPNIPKGQITYLNGTTFLGSIMKLSCVIGYQLIGNAIRECTVNGQWNGDVPKCEIIDCGEPNLVENGKVKLQGTIYNSIATYECLNTFRLRGPEKRKCLEDGSWSDRDPMCEVIDCGKPKIIKHGIGRLLNDSTAINSMVYYKCLPNYQLIGPEFHTCLSTGEWSGPNTHCVLTKVNQTSVLNTKPVKNIKAESDASVDQNDSSVLIIGIGIASGIVFLIIITVSIAVIRVKMRKNVEVKKTEERVESTIQNDCVGMVSYLSFDSDTSLCNGNKQQNLSNYSNGKKDNILQHLNKEITVNSTDNQTAIT